MAKKILTWAFLLFLVLQTKAQILYDFEDGQLTGWDQSTAGHWDASSDYPISGLFSLHHIFDSQVSGHDQVSIPVNIDFASGTVVWKFKIKHGYSPSSSNNWAVFLLSDKPASYINPDSVFSGYAIGVDLFSYSDDTLSLFRVDSGNLSVIYRTPLNWQEQIGTNPAALVVSRDANGVWKIFISQSLNYDSLTYLGQVTDNNFTAGQYFGIYYEYTYAQDQKLWFDDLEIYYPQNAQSSSFSIQKLTDTIASTVNSSPGSAVAQITFTDAGDDGVPTYIRSVTLTPGTNNQVADWSKLLAGAKLIAGAEEFDAKITKNTLTFPVNITIDDGQSKTFTIYIWLKKNPDVADNSLIDFSLSNSQITVLPGGSGFALQQAATGAVVYSVTAEKLIFDKVPLTVKPDKDFSLTVLAVDRNGNLDTDVSVNVTLSLASGSGVLTSVSGLSRTMNGGLARWSDLRYSDFGYFSLFAEAVGFSVIKSPDILCNSYLYFLNDNFEDGDISDWLQLYPGHWQASSDNPIDGNFSLAQIYDNPEAATEYISYELVNVEYDTTLVWRFNLRYDNQTPSSTNNWNVILFADTLPSVGAEFNGYAIGVDWDKTDDLLTFYRLDKGIPQPVLTTSLNWQENISGGKVVDFQILRTTNGTWTIQVDTVPGLFDNWITLGSVSDNTYTQANYFSVRYRYTSTQDRKLTLDNTYFGEIIPDTIPPHIDTAFAISPVRILLWFNEAVNPQTIIPGNFVLDSIGIQAVYPDSTNPKKIEILLTDSLSEQVTYFLTVKNVEDFSGNKLIEDSVAITFEYFRLVGFYFPDYNKITLNFNRQVDPMRANIIQGYNLAPSAGEISVVSVQGNSVTLGFEQNLVFRRYYILKFDSITDAYGNLPFNSALNFMFYIAQPNDVVINEVMFDVSPEPPALPPYKYIEIYNRTGIDLNMTGWKLTVGSSPEFDFGSVTLPAHGYAIICAEDAREFFENITVSVPVLNTSYLTTTGKEIVLNNNLGQTIDRIEYSTDWYNDTQRDDGGWSVERIDPNNLCNQDINWHASLNPMGGSPGLENSVRADNPDTTALKVVGINPINSKYLQVTFNKSVEPQSATQQMNYIINGSATPLFLSVNEENNRAVDLYFVGSFRDGENSLMISNVSDFCGNIVKDTTVVFMFQKIHPIAVEPVSSRQLKVMFSEPVDLTTAQDIQNYAVDSLHPVLALRDQNDLSVVHLLFDFDFKSDTVYSLVISGVEDFSGTVCDTTVLSFAIHQPRRGDLVFNEFMTDVSPAPAGLSPYKYIELYNNTDFDIWLSGWTLIMPDGKVYDLPETYVKANGYLVLTEKNASLGVSAETGLISGYDFSSEGLYVLKNASDQLIDAAYLSPEYWDDEQKSQGGWSLERLNTTVLCQSDTLWTACNDPSGGTPGEVNSVFNSSFQGMRNKVDEFQVVNAKTLELKFSAIITNSTVFSPGSYSLSGAQTDSITSEDYLSFKLYYGSQLQDNQSYEFKVNALNDCGLPLIYDTVFIYRKIHLAKLLPLDSNLLMLEFSEEVPDVSAYNSENYLLNDAVYPDYVLKNANNPAQVYLYFPEVFINGQNTLFVTGITDIFGNLADSKTYEFVYYVPDSGGIVINEILFNPLPGGARYVELYNTGDYPVYLHHVYLSNYENGQLINAVPVTDDLEMLLDAGQYLVVTTDTLNVKNTYPYHGENFVQVKELPKMYNDQGNIAVFYARKLLDYVVYSEQMHSPLISDPEGVALEKINPFLASDDKNNWISAASSVGYGTPGLKNSQYIELDTSVSADVIVKPAVFSPDNDGYDDLLWITINTDEPDVFCDITVTNRYGLVIKRLVKNELIASTQSFYWDGTDGQNRVQPRGIYVINVKLYTPQGKVKIYRQAVALVKR